MNSRPHKKQLQKLIQKFLDGKATAEETAFLEDYYAHFEQEPDILDAMHPDRKQQLASKMEASIKRQIQQREAGSPVTNQEKLPRYWWAAAAVLILMVGGYFFHRHQNNQKAAQLSASIIAPGHDGAVLTLGNGTKILLDSAGKGNIASQGNIKIVNRNGEITYIIDSEKAQTANNTIAYNTLETPRGRRFKIVLPDGTQVWLNSASSLKYPTAFASNERNVELTGEAYFEVVHNPSMPFIVHTKRTDVRVLGTGFNVMAYDDENAERTTLVHGLVQVSSTEDKTQQAIIHPGQQAVLLAGGNTLDIRKADTSEVLAWLNGQFIFDNGSIQYVMRQIARWYDVSVRYEGNMDNIRFEGVLSKRDNINDILEAIQTTNEVRFKIEDKTITVIAGK